MDVEIMRIEQEGDFSPSMRICWHALCSPEDSWVIVPVYVTSEGEWQKQATVIEEINY
jgi:hypothetical protein